MSKLLYFSTLFSLLASTVLLRNRGLHHLGGLAESAAIFVLGWIACESQYDN